MFDFDDRRTSTLEPSQAQNDMHFDFILNALNNGDPIIYSKINHGFWERMVAIEAAGESLLESNPERAKFIDALPGESRQAPYMLGSGFLGELMTIFKTLPQRPNHYLFSANLSAWPERESIAGPPKEDEILCRQMINRLLPAGAITSGLDGLEFKRAVLNGRFADFLKIIQTRRSIFVGNSDLMDFPLTLSLPQCETYQIDGIAARRDRQDTLENLSTQLREAKDINLVMLQAGGSLSAWLIHYLQTRHPKVSFLDLGLAANICRPELLFKKPFGRIYRGQLVQTAKRVVSGFNIDNLSEEIRSGRDAGAVALAASLGVPHFDSVFDPPVPIEQPIAFLESKPKDSERIKHLCAMQSCQKREVNEFKVCSLLEQTLEKKLDLPPSRKVVMCKSSAIGLHVAAEIHALRKDMSLQWVSSAFGFIPSNKRSFGDIRLLDCDREGLLPVPKLISSHEGVLFKNIFAKGLKRWNEIRANLRDKGTSLIVDNASGLLDRPKTSALPHEIEVVSCDQTKPWGVEEGAFMILDTQDVSTGRNLLNSNVNRGSEASFAVINGKISERTCATLYDRIERMPHWSFFYDRQAIRILRLAARFSPDLIPFSHARSPAAYIPFVAPYHISIGQLDNPHFVIRHTDNPPTFDQSSFLQTSKLNDRIICIPCHPQIRHVSNDLIASVFAALGTSNAT